MRANIAPSKILIVDDIKNNIEMITLMLSGAGYDIRSTTDSDSALSMVEEFVPDIVLTDMNMPGKDGLELCVALKKAGEIAVIMITAAPEYRARALLAGADDFLTKPVNSKALLARLRALSRLTGLVRDRRRCVGNSIVKMSDVTLSDSVARVVGADGLCLLDIRDCLAKAGTSCTVKADVNSDLALTLINDAQDLSLISDIRARDAQLPIVALLEDESLAPLSLDLGASDYVTMPLDRSELLARTRTQIRYSRYITKITAVQDEVLSLAYIDPLTKMRNRRYIQDNIDGFFSKHTQDRNFSLIMIDVDHFKHINDNFGHTSGDEVLATIASIVSTHVGKHGEDHAARYGGEELLVMLNSNGAAAYQLADEVRRAVESAKPRDINVTISAGVAFMGATDQNYRDILARADAALYAAKRAGRNTVIMG
jgi:two-component system cell cycle response regulator